MSKRRIRKRLAFVAIILVLALVMVFSGLQILESTVFYEDATEPVYHTKTITSEGVSYFPRQDITTVLVMGIDEEGPVVSSGSHRNYGEVDMIALIILDHTTEEYRVVSINRDTMLDMPMLGLGGKRAGNFYGQLALSHTYGSGLEDSAENTLTAVSDLLYGLQMDYYVTLNMDAIGMLNDAVGGVTVEVTEDFSQVDPTITKGTVTLNRSQAIHYVRSRKDVGAQLNVTRMERQEGYIRGLMEALLEKVNSSSRFALDLYEDMAEYTVTNCSPKVLTSILNTCAQYELGGMSTLPGENVRGERYYEFYPDKEKIFTMVLDLCYEPKE